MTDNQQPHLPPARRQGETSFETPSPGDGYSYDKGALQELATWYEGLGKKYRIDQQHALIITRTPQFASDFSSAGNATAFQRSGESLQGSLRQCEQYCREQAAKYRAALEKYAAAEDAHSADIDKAGRSL
ncbi:PE domain-containing protein [Amycolatopsis rubida]|uniref:PE domain-containing protein n=1 Tax=Amycolatopsis rubida TaxID=112413 RepID=A0A1I5J855_9PSEU|nr:MULTISPECIES: PE domain-containing protein [Amycolatopsis]MYW93355.1 hypothetical protein [Amycolatopsis rubida]NEC58342.1 PE domain-containing protein [Amycolatopsis rubida]OAP28657.1 hypothetical protein A4R44_00448 [Amycolatopsis sp. M39]SFO68576.1 PE family protein [Amycolatopsis rubida]